MGRGAHVRVAEAMSHEMAASSTAATNIAGRPKPPELGDHVSDMRVLTTTARPRCPGDETSGTTSRPAPTLGSDLGWWGRWRNTPAGSRGLRDATAQQRVQQSGRKKQEGGLTVKLHVSERA